MCCEKSPLNAFKENGLIEMRCPECSAISQVRMLNGFNKFLSDCPGCKAELKVMPTIHTERANWVALELKITVISKPEIKPKPEIKTNLRAV